MCIRDSLRRVQGVQGQQIPQHSEKGGQAVQLLLSQPPGKGCGDSSRTRGRGIAPGPVMKDRQTDHPRTMLCGRPPGDVYKRQDNNVFNLGNGVGFTVKEVIDVARKVTGHPIPAEISPRRAGDPAQLVASSDKAKDVLGWKPQYADLETIVSSAWAWHKGHPHGFAD